MGLLTSCNTAGCSAKMSSIDLDNIVGGVFNTTNKYKEDASVNSFPINCQIVQSLDFIAPIIDDPYIFGQIAVLHSLSDIYAMGATPLYAMNVCCFPEISDENKETIKQILLGASFQLEKEQVNLVGGHTIINEEIRYGLSVNGYIEHNKTPTSNKNLNDGDVLILTKPIGIGILSSYLKLEYDKSIENILANICLQSNSIGKDLTDLFPIKCMTDISGFGLIGHLLELAKASNKTINISYQDIPIIDEALQILDNYNIYSKRTKENKQAFESSTKISNCYKYMEQILYDPQTSGGLLIAVNKYYCNNVIDYLKDNCSITGIVKPYDSHYIVVE